jgi:hypothetical protein
VALRCYDMNVTNATNSDWGRTGAVNADRASRGRADRAGPGLGEPREMTAKPHPRRAEPTCGVEDEPVRLR